RSHLTRAHARVLELEKRKAELEAAEPVPPSPRLHPKLAEVYAKKVRRASWMTRPSACRGEGDRRTGRIITSHDPFPADPRSTARASLAMPRSISASSTLA